MARALGMDALFDVNGLEKAALQFTDVAREGMLDGALAIGTAAIDGVKVLASGLGTALEFSGQGLSKIADDVTKKVGAAFSGFRLPDAAKVPITLSAEKDKAEKVARADPVKVDYGRLRADKMEASFRALAGVGGNLRDSLEMAGALEVPRQLEQFSGDALKSVKGIEDVRDFLHKIGASAGESEKYLAAWEKWNEDQRKAAQHVDRLRADRAPVAAQQFLGGGQTFGDAARMAGVTSGIPAALEGLSGATLTTVSAWEDLEDQLAQVRDLNPVVREFYDASRKTFEDALAKQRNWRNPERQPSPASRTASSARWARLAESSRQLPARWRSRSVPLGRSSESSLNLYQAARASRPWCLRSTAYSKGFRMRSDSSSSLWRWSSMRFNPSSRPSARLSRRCCRSSMRFSSHSSPYL